MPGTGFGAGDEEGKLQLFHVTFATKSVSSKPFGATTLCWMFEWVKFALKTPTASNMFIH